MAGAGAKAGAGARAGAAGAATGGAVGAGAAARAGLSTGVARGSAHAQNPKTAMKTMTRMVGSFPHALRGAREYSGIEIGPRGEFPAPVRRLRRSSALSLRNRRSKCQVYVFTQIPCSALICIRIRRPGMGVGG
ncbi:MAG: hypothetical protein EXR79_16690 [Myxococcales bacterium]|nr:hypothetical protein [Myxococcales bacterium]